MTLAGCTSIPQGRSAVDAVDLRGARALDEGAVSDKIATAPTEKFLGLFRGILYDYEVYDPSVLQRDMARIERYYRGKGFLEVHAREGRVEQLSPQHVRVEILVEEGPPTLNLKVQIDGLDAVSIPVAVADAVRAAAADKVPVGGRFDEDSYKSAKDALKRALTDRGYAYATVDADATIDLGARVASYVFKVRAGPLAKFGAITIVGLDPDGKGPRPQEIEEAPLRRAMNLTEGTPYSTAELDAATQSLLDLEVFSAVQIIPDLPEPPPANPIVPLRVSVEPTRLRLLRLGFGAEFDEIKTDLHVIGGWEDHNFLGGLRDLSIAFQPGVVPWPFRAGCSDCGPNTWKFLPEERLKVQFRQPSFLEAHTGGFLKPEFNVFPFLVQPNPSPTSPVVGYVEGKGAAGVDRPFGKLFVTLSYNEQIESPFKYTSSDQPLPSTIFLAYPQLVTTLDFRDNALHPHKGFYVGNDLQLGLGGAFGSAADLRVQPELRGYIPLGKRVTLASRASMGFLFASNYPGNGKKSLADVLTSLASATDPNQASDLRDVEIVYFRGFFSGGPSTNRGFPIRGIAPYGFVPYLLPQTATAQLTNGCAPGGPNVGTPQCELPIAGLTLWEFSEEARFQVAGPFSASVFCDFGDVAPQQVEIRFDHLHASCGAGVRYDTPVGPIRLDIGYRIQPLQVLGLASEQAASNRDPLNGPPQPLLLGQPIAIAFGIGEAY